MDELRRLIDRLEQSASLDARDARLLYREYVANIHEQLRDGATPTQPWRTLSILSQSEEAFHGDLKAIENDLFGQIAIIGEGLDLWFQYGIVVPPHYPRRVAIILAKAKRQGEEREFLAAWCRHFGGSVAHTSVVERARKRGIAI